MLTCGVAWFVLDICSQVYSVSWNVSLPSSSSRSGAALTTSRERLDPTGAVAQALAVAVAHRDPGYGECGSGLRRCTDTSTSGPARLSRVVLDVPNGIIAAPGRSSTTPGRNARMLHARTDDRRLRRSETLLMAPPAGFEPALPPPEGGALSPELRGPMARLGGPVETIHHLSSAFDAPLRLAA